MSDEKDASTAVEKLNAAIKEGKELTQKLNANADVVVKLRKLIDASDPARLESPQTSKNTLKDIIDYLKLGDMVIIHSNHQHEIVFHNCVDASVSTSGDGSGVESTDANKIRLISIDVGSCVDLLDGGEWPWYIRDSECTQCTCGMKADSITAQYSFELPLGRS